MGRGLFRRVPGIVLEVVSVVGQFGLGRGVCFALMNRFVVIPYI